MESIGVSTPAYLHQAAAGETKILHGHTGTEGKDASPFQGDTVSIVSPAALPEKKKTAKRAHSKGAAAGSETVVTTAVKSAGQQGVPTHLSMEDHTPGLSSEQGAGGKSINRAFRQETCTRMKSLAGGLEKGELTGEEFSLAAGELYDYAHGSGSEDPLVRTVALHLLAQHVSCESAAGLWVYHRGPVAGPSGYLARLDTTLLNARDRVHVSDGHEVPGFVDTLEKNTGEGPVPGEALSAVAHLAHTFYQRGGPRIKPHAQEPAGKDQALADRLGSLVSSWWSHGQIEVVQQGKPVAPGTVDLKECLAAERVQVYGSSIVLTPPARNKKLSKELQACADKLQHDYKDNCEGLEMLTGLYGKDARAAEKVIAFLVDEAAPHVQHTFMESVLAKVMEKAGTRPWLKELITPHVERIMNFPKEAEARDTLKHHNLIWSHQVNTARQVSALFPEMKGPALVSGILLPLARTDEPNVQRSFHEFFDPLIGDPSMPLAPLFDTLASSQEPLMNDGQWKTLSLGLERTAWRPSADQVEELAARLYFPPGKENHSLFAGTTWSDSFAGGLHFFRLLEEKDPEALRGLELPDLHGTLVPLKKALLERVRNDSINRLLEFLAGEHYNGALHELYQLLSSDPGIAGELMDEVSKGLAAAGSLQKMTLPEQQAFAILGGMKPGEPTASELYSLLSSYRDVDSGSRAMNAVVRRGLTACVGERVKTLESGTLSPREAVDFSRDLLYSLYCAGQDSIIPGFELADRIGAALEKSVNPSGARFQAITGELMKSLKKACASSATIKDLSPAGVMDFQELSYLSRPDKALRQELKDFIVPLLKKDRGFHSGYLKSLFIHFFQGEIMGNLQRIREEGLTRSERMVLMAENMTLAPVGGRGNKYEVGQLLTGLRERLGTSADPVIADMHGTIKSDVNLYNTYNQVAPPGVDDGGLTPYWADFRDTLERLGGEEEPKAEKGVDEQVDRLFGRNDLKGPTVPMGRFDTALEIHHFVLEGVAKEKAIAHVLECLSLGQDPRAVPIGDGSGTPALSIEFEQSDDELMIDGIKLRINDAN